MTLHRASLGLSSCTMSDVFILGRAAAYLTTFDTFLGVLLASKEVRAEALAHAEVRLG